MGNLVFQATLGGQVNLVGPNTASTFNLNVPAVSSTIATTSGTETLTNKTLTSPVISGGTIDNAVIGGTTAAAGSFTTLSASSTLSVTGAGTIQGLTVGKGAGAVASNTVVGNGALASGSQSGGGNNAFGQYSLAVNTSGATNNAYGNETLYANTTGAAGAAFGHKALWSNTTGSYNVGVGYNALYSNTTASSSTAVGYQASYTSTAAVGVTSIGYQANYSMTTTGNIYSTAVGYQAAKGAAGATNYYDVALGAFSLYSVTTGYNNTCLGINSGYYITTGYKNTILGSYNGNQGGYDIRTSSNYIVLSDGDGNPVGVYQPSGASYQHIINSSTGATYSQLTFAIASALKSAIYWDNTSSRLYTYTNTTGPYISNGNGSWTNSSDERLKNITGEIQNGLAKVCTLRAAEYTWKDDEEAKPKVGLIAQDVLAVLPEAVDVPVEGSTDRDGNPSMMGVSYTDVIPLLVAAIKELKAEIDTLKGQA